MQAKVCLRLHIDMQGDTYMFHQVVCSFALSPSYFLFFFLLASHFDEGLTVFSFFL
jgi:hypothetical protein